MTNVRQQYVLPGKHTAVTGVTITFAWNAASTPWNLFIVSIVVEADSFTRAGCSDGNGILWDILGSEPFETEVSVSVPTFRSNGHIL